MKSSPLTKKTPERLLSDTIFHRLNVARQKDNRKRPP